MGPKRDHSLLGHLTEVLQCPYISELRRADNYRDLAWLIRFIPAEDYPEREWRDALSYLTGLRPEGGATVNALKNQLVSWLKQAEKPP